MTAGATTHDLQAARAGACLLTAAGGAMDAWVYLAHGHLFANAQTGNVVLLALAAAAGRPAESVRDLVPIAAFITGLFLSRLAGAWLKRQGLNSRTVRLGAECVALLVLASVLSLTVLPDGVVTACVGLIAAVQITSLSHIGETGFNTGMTTGNLRGAVSATVSAWTGRSATPDRGKTLTLWSLCAAFPAGALAGGLCTHRFGDRTVLLIVALVGCGIAAMRRLPDPLPDLGPA